MRKIKVSLFHLYPAIKELRDLLENIPKLARDLVEIMCREGVEIAKANVVRMGIVDTGDLLESIHYAISGNGTYGVIRVDSDHGLYVEFGTGVVGSLDPHPQASPSQYDVNGHGWDGWYYFNDRKQKIQWTAGVGSRPFMWETARMLSQQTVDMAREVFEKT